MQEKVKLSFDGKASLLSGIALVIVSSSVFALQFLNLANTSLFSVAAAGVCGIIGVIFCAIPLSKLKDRESFRRGRKSAFIEVR